jgi:predicted secreted protein
VTQNDADIIPVDESANGKDIELLRGAALRLHLPESPATGYRWTLISGGAPALDLLREEREPAAGAMGGSGQHDWIFRAVEAGVGRIELHYARPWESKGTPDRAFTLQVRVQ